MTDTTNHDFVVGAFKSRAGAGLALTALADARSEALRGIRELAVVQRGEDNYLRFEERNDMSSTATAVGGGTLGLLLGIVGGPLGMLIGGATGALIGGVGGKVIDTGIPDDRLRAIGQQLTPNSSAVVALVEGGQSGALAAALQQAGATIMNESISGQAVAALNEARIQNVDSVQDVRDQTTLANEDVKKNTGLGI